MEVERFAIELRRVNRIFHTGVRNCFALRDVDLTVQSGEFTAVVGKSGSGKSTLINVIAGIDRPDSGEVIVNGTAVHRMNEDQVAAWRGKTIGIVFQFFQLLPTLTVLENVQLAMDFCGHVPANERRYRSHHLLEQFGIGDQAHKLPANLSGGQQQRAAMARALANDPPILVADEPTGNLDSSTAESVLQLFCDLSRKGKTIVMVTHERELEHYVNRVIHLQDGSVAV